MPPLNDSYFAECETTLQRKLNIIEELIEKAMFSLDFDAYRRWRNVQQKLKAEQLELEMPGRQQFPAELEQLNLAESVFLRGGVDNVKKPPNKPVAIKTGSQEKQIKEVNVPIVKSDYLDPKLMEKLIDLVKQFIPNPTTQEYGHMSMEHYPFDLELPDVQSECPNQGRLYERKRVSSQHADGRQSPTPFEQPLSIDIPSIDICVRQFYQRNGKDVSATSLPGSLVPIMSPVLSDEAPTPSSRELTLNTWSSTVNWKPAIWSRAEKAAVSEEKCC